jgi:hypothetical protein
MAANTLLTISMISRDAAMVLGNSLDLAKRVNREQDGAFAIKTAQIGQTVNVRRPIRPTVRTGSVVDIQAITETYSPLTFSDPIGTDYALTSQELTFSVEDYFGKVVKPSVARIASEIESQGQALITQFYNTIGTPGVALTGGPTGTARSAVSSALAMLNKNDAPREAGRKTLLNDPDFNGVLVDNSAALFNPSAEIAKMYTDGYQGTYASFTVFMNQLVRSTTNGTFSGSITVQTTVPANSTWATTSQITTQGWTGAPAVGQVFTIGTGATSVYMVNPQTKQALSTKQQFSVQAVTDNGGGSLTLTVAPAIVTSGGFQNVSRAPTATDVVTNLGATGVSTQNALAFDKDAIMLACQELMPYSVGLGKTTTDDQTNIPIRVQQMPDIRTNQEILRFDVMTAWATLYSQLAVRVCTT